MMRSASRKRTRGSGWGRWARRRAGELAVALWAQGEPAAGWAAPTSKAPNEPRQREAAELKQDYERLHEEGKHAEATALAARACAILREEHGSGSLEAAGCLNDLGLLYYAQGEYGRAETLHERALASREKALGPEHLDVASSLNNLAAVYDEKGEHEKAEPLYLRALAIREKALGPDDPGVASSLNNLAFLYELQGEYERAVPLLERALAILEDALGPEHPDVASCLDNLAHVYEAQGAYRRAEPLIARALVIREKALGPGHLDVAMSLNNLAGLHLDRGAYEEAAPLYQRALAIFEEVLGPQHPSVATSLNNLAELYRARGADERAEPLYLRALAIYEEALGPQHPSVATALGNLAGLYLDQGAHGKAEPLYLRALAIREEALRRDHPAVAQSLNDLAELYRTQGQYAEAEPLYLRALAIHEEALGPDHPQVATSLNNLASLYWAQGAYARAEPLYLRALAIREEALGPGHPQVAGSLHNLASLYWAQGAYAKAEPPGERALAVWEEALGPDHPKVALGLNTLAMLRDDQGDHDTALELRRRALDIEDANLARTLTVAEESRRLALASTLSGSLHYALSLHLRVAPEHDAIGELALTALLRRKNRVQELVAQSSAELRRSSSEDDRRILDDLADIDSQIAVLSNRGPGSLGVEAFRRRLDALGDARGRLFGELARRGALVDSPDHPVTIDGVQRALPRGSALVELALYEPRHGADGRSLRKHDPAPPPRYAAYVLSPARFTFVDLGPAAPIDGHIKAFRRALQTGQAIPTDLYDSVMRPIVEELGSADRLIIAPAGDLSAIPFGALHDGRRYLIERYELRYVATGRDLLAPPAAAPVATTAITLVANPTGAGLEDAELEAEAITSVFPDVRVLRGDQATETNVRAIERPLVLHMATHGFFGKARNERDNPMLRSGLYLADVDQVRVDRERDDGRLTAYEVSGMDLRGTQLVVLSACKTGLGAATTVEGKVLMSEGVSGLRRAFATAGARTTVMSLWEVSGVTAQATMEAYYRKLAEGLGRAEAMQAVQLELLQSKDHAHPKDWAAFIVSGDDAPMELPARHSLRRAADEPPQTEARAGCAAGPSRRRGPTSATLVGLLGLVTLRRRRR